MGGSVPADPAAPCPDAGAQVSRVTACVCARAHAQTRAESPPNRSVLRASPEESAEPGGIASPRVPPARPRALRRGQSGRRAEPGAGQWCLAARAESEPEAEGLGADGSVLTVTSQQGERVDLRASVRV